MQSAEYGKVVGAEEIRWAQPKPFHFDFIKENKGITEIVPTCDFLEGITLDRQQVYLYMTLPMQLHEGVTHFNTDVVIVGRNVKERKITGLQFTGGTLGLLFMPDRLDIDMTEKGDYSVTCKSDRIEQKVVIGEKEYTIAVESSLHEKFGVSGRSLVNDQVIFEVVATEGIEMKEVIPLYNAVHKMFRFLTFRKNIRFEKTELLFEEYYGDEVYHATGATMHCKDHFENATEKRWISCIPIKTVENCMGKLFRMIYEERENKPYFSLDFLPENDEDAGWISLEKVRNICTALECEAMLQKLTAENDPRFRALIKEVKNIVTVHRKGENALPGKTYDLIDNSISHWDYAAADKVKALFHKYEEILIQSRCFQMSVAKFEEGIDRIIRSRNRVTHGNFASISNEDALIAVNLMNLIYISRLDRLGVGEEAVRELMKRSVVY